MARYYNAKFEHCSEFVNFFHVKKRRLFSPCRGRNVSTDGFLIALLCKMFYVNFRPVSFFIFNRVRGRSPLKKPPSGSLKV